MIERKINMIKELLNSHKGKFNFYQKLPPCVKRHIPELDGDHYQQKQVSVDTQRFDWLTKNLDVRGMRVTEIGASIGYFSVRLGAEFNASVFAYEPIAHYSTLINLFCELCNLGDRVKGVNKGVSINDIEDLPEGDLIVSLNTLHHAGSSYDTDLVRDISDWRGYAIDYLKELNKKYKFLFLQTGNVWKGKVIFISEETVSFVKGLLVDSGWDILKMGVIEDFTVMDYKTYDNASISEVQPVTAYRNKETGLVDYFDRDDCIASMPSGLAQRPLWLCKVAT